VPGEAVQIGPFSGGLNTYSDPTAVADNELVVCENLELDLDGSLKSRPPISDIGVNFPLGASGNMELLGYYYADENVPYLLASDGLSSTYYLSGDSWILITNTVAASAMAQFNGKAWLLSPQGGANPGGSWDPVGGFVAVADMPHGEVIVAYKFRLWVAAGKNAATNSTRLYFSNLLGVTPFWPTTAEFIDVGAGDGQSIVQLTIYYNSLLIFRTNSIYGFSYQSDPASGVVSNVVPGIGLESRDCLVSYESYLYFFYDGRAYEFINNRASQINTPVPFVSSNQAGVYKPFAVSSFNRRIIFSFYDVMYSFNLRNRTWSTWKSSEVGAVGQIIEKPGDGSTNIAAVAVSSDAVALGGTRVAKTLEIVDGVTSNKEDMTCTLQTKNYDYQAPSQYKRLFWWGISAVFRDTVVGTATPIVLSYGVTWTDLLTHLWDELLEHEWDQPLSDTLKAEDSQNTLGATAKRKFVRFHGDGLRFRQLNFKVVFTTDGSTDTAPVRLFSLTTYVLAKEHVSKVTT
jgi:hypothetical protein